MATIPAVFEPYDSSRTVFEQIGGEPGVRALTDQFYDLMEIEPDLAELRALHGPSLENARQRLFWFLCGYFGGPEHYVERFGHPRLRARHLPFPIDAQARDQWVVCMGRAMRDRQLPEPLAERLLQSFYATADWLRNRAG